jgi:hypothetical protein
LLSRQLYVIGCLDLGTGGDRLTLLSLLLANLDGVEKHLASRATVD